MQSERLEQILRSAEHGEKINPCLIGQLDSKENSDLAREILKRRNSGQQFLPEQTISIVDMRLQVRTGQGADVTCQVKTEDPVKEALRDWNVAAVNGRDVTREFERLPEAQKREFARTIEQGNARSEKEYPLLSIERSADGRLHLRETRLKSESNLSPELAKVMDQSYQASQETARHAHADHLATGIQNAARGDVVHNDEGAKLELRQKVAALKNEDPRVVADVVEQLTNEGSRIDPRKPPAAEIRYSTDEHGQRVASEIVFSSYLTTSSGRDIVSLTKTVEAQAKDAQEKFDRMPVGFLTAGAKAQHDIALENGTLPEDRKLWFERVPDRQQ